jgi:hypothetical protein
VSGFAIPTEPPPVLFAVDFADQEALARTPLTLPNGASAADGQLRFTADAPAVAAGLPLGNRAFGDVVLQTQISLLEGAPDDRYGIFVRRPTAGPKAGRFACFAVGPDGHFAVRGFDGQLFHDVIDAELAPGSTFAPGLGDPNLFQAVTSGPQVTFLLNDQVIIGLALDLPLGQGELGLFLQRGTSAPRATIGIDWIHVRALIAPNEGRR